MTLALAGCSSAPDKSKEEEPPRTYVEHRNNVVVQHVNEHHDPDTGALVEGWPDDEPKPVQTRRLNLGEGHVDERLEDSRPIPLARTVEIVTWADEVIRGVLVAESPEAYTIDVTPDAQASLGRKLRQVPRAAVQSLRTRRSSD